MTENNLPSLLEKMASHSERSRGDLLEELNSIFEVPITGEGLARNVILSHHYLEDQHDDLSLRFLTRLKSFILEQNAPSETLLDDTAEWVITVLEEAGPHLLLSEAELIFGVIEEVPAQSDMLSTWLFGRLCERMIKNGIATRDDATRIVRTMNLVQAPLVSREEAARLYEVNDIIGTAENDPSWALVFSRAVGNCLLGMAHPNPEVAANVLDRRIWLSADRRNLSGVAETVISDLDKSGWFEGLAASALHAERAREKASKPPKTETKRSLFDRIRGVAGPKAEESNVVQNGWLKRRLGWQANTSAGEQALVDLLNLQAPGFLRALPAAVAA